MQLDFFKDEEEKSELDIEYKECKQCNASLPNTTDYFYVCNTAKNGTIYLEVQCKTCSKHNFKVTKLLKTKNFKKDKPTCDICGVKESKVKGVLHLDHCHKTDKFRGWLCNNCNHGLGCFKEDETIFIKAMQYMRKSNK